MTAPTITREQAEAVLDAVREQFRAYLQPITLDSGRVLSPCCSQPQLDMDYDGQPAIIWEDGPDEWALRVTEGGPSEEDHVLAAEAAREFGVAHRAPTGPAPARLPADIWVDALNSCVLGIYPDQWRW